MEQKAGATAHQPKKVDLLKTAAGVQRVLSGLNKEQKLFVLNFAKGAVDLDSQSTAIDSGADIFNEQSV